MTTGFKPESDGNQKEPAPAGFPAGVHASQGNSRPNVHQRFGTSLFPVICLIISGKWIDHSCSRGESLATPADRQAVCRLFPPDVAQQFAGSPPQGRDNVQLEYQQSLVMQQYQLQAQYQMLQYGKMQHPGQMMPMMPLGGGYPGYGQSAHITVETMHAQNIDELKRFVSMVDPVDVKRVIEQCKMVPREMAYTSLIQMAGKMRQVQKAVAIFEAMTDSKHAVKPNMYSYTALISALARVGDWKLAEKYFSEMSTRAETDPSVAPNRVTFSSMISVYEKAGMFDSAIQVYERQIEAKIRPDLITYMAVLGACKASGEEKAMQRAAEIIDDMHASNLTATSMTYLNVIAACENHPQIALRMLRSMTKRNVEITPGIYNSVMNALYTGRLKDEAVQLAKSADRASVRLNHVFFDSVLKLCSEAGDYHSADALHRIMIRSGMRMSPQIAGLILCAHMQGNDSVEVIEQLNDRFRADGVIPLLPARKEVVECVHEVLSNTNNTVNDGLTTKVAYELSDMSAHSILDSSDVVDAPH